MNELSKGCVYVLVFDDGALKIGRSIDPDRRIRELSTLSGRQIIRKYFTEPHFNYKETEALAHGKFSGDRTVGEYFKSDFNTVVEFVNSLNKVTDIDFEVSGSDNEAISDSAWSFAEVQLKRVHDSITISERKNMLITVLEAIEDAENGVCSYKVAVESILSVVQSMLEKAISDQEST